MRHRSSRSWSPAAGLAIALVVALAGPDEVPALTAAPAQVQEKPPAVGIDQKVAWILRLEQERTLRDASAPEVLSGDPAAPRGFVPATSPHLGALSIDPDAALRRRAVLAIGRTRVPEGARWLVSALTDPVAEVRAAAAFALGQHGTPAAVAALRAALSDPDAAVRGRAADGLGLIGAPAAATAGAIADAFAGCGTLLSAVTGEHDVVLDPGVDACRLALFALVRLRNYDALTRVALDAQGAPASPSWPIAFALQRINDRRAADALASLAGSADPSVAGFAIRGLGALRDPRAASIAAPLVANADLDLKVRVAALRALAQAGGAAAVEPIARLAFDRMTPPNLALEAVTALGTMGDARVFSDLIDLFTSPWPAMRLAAMTAAASLNREGFLLLLSSLPPDPDPVVRSGLASAIAALPRETALPVLEAMASDQDARVVGPVLAALGRLNAPELGAVLVTALGAADFAVRATAARLVGEKKITGAVPRLVGAYERGQSDAAPDARLAAVEALAAHGGEEALTVLRRALADPSWPVRLRAAALMRAAGHAGVEPQRPAPLRESAVIFESDAVLRPPYSPHAFVETPRGTIEIELNVVESPLTSRSFIQLARAGFYNGLKVHRLVPGFVVQTGDPRGDGRGGPGYTVVDELSSLPFLRGTVGVAISGPDTGGSQFFITLSPQPHLDGQYTAFGRVVDGWDVLDRIQAGDVITRIRIWDGVTFRQE